MTPRHFPHWVADWRAKEMERRQMDRGHIHINMWLLIEIIAAIGAGAALVAIIIGLWGQS